MCTAENIPDVPNFILINSDAGIYKNILSQIEYQLKLIIITISRGVAPLYYFNKYHDGACIL